MLPNPQQLEFSRRLANHAGSLIIELGLSLRCRSCGEPIVFSPSERHLGVDRSLTQSDPSGELMGCGMTFLHHGCALLGAAERDGSIFFTKAEP